MNELLSAVKTQNLNVLELKGVISANELNTLIENEKTLFMIACEEGLGNSVEFLLKQPALDPDKDDGEPNYHTAVMLAIDNDHKKIVGMILEKSDLKLSLRDLNRAFIYYAGQGDVIKMQLCLEKGADINAVYLEHTALHEAVWKDQLESVKFLLSQQEVKPNTMSRARRTAFIWALMDEEGNNRKQIIEAFVERHLQFHDIDLTLSSYFEGTPLTEAIFRKEFDLANKLIELEGDTFSLGNHPEALNWAVRKNHLEVVRKMLDKDPTGIHLPCGGKKIEVEQIPGVLLQQEYDSTTSAIDIDRCNNLPLNWAIAKGHQQMTELLLDKGASPEQMNLHGISAKSLAQAKDYKYPHIKAKLLGHPSAISKKSLRTSLEMGAMGIFKSDSPHSPEDTGRDKKESSPGREEKSIEMLLEERIKERAKQDAEFLARLEGLKAKVKEEKKLSSGSEEIPPNIAQAFQKAEAMIKESTQQDEKNLETFKTSQSSQGNSPK